MLTVIGINACTWIKNNQLPVTSAYSDQQGFFCCSLGLKNYRVFRFLVLSVINSILNAHLTFPLAKRYKDNRLIWGMYFALLSDFVIYLKFCVIDIYFNLLITRSDNKITKNLNISYNSKFVYNYTTLISQTFSRRKIVPTQISFLKCVFFN